MEAGLAVETFSAVTPNPKDHEVMAGARFFADKACDALVAVGGGSVLDCAKGIGVVIANGGHIADYEGVDTIESPMPPLVCVPTTSGSSADVSQFAIISDTRRKVKIDHQAEALHFKAPRVFLSFFARHSSLCQG